MTSPAITDIEKTADLLWKVRDELVAFLGPNGPWERKLTDPVVTDAERAVLHEKAVAIANAMSDMGWFEELLVPEINNRLSAPSARDAAYVNPSAQDAVDAVYRAATVDTSHFRRSS